MSLQPRVLLCCEHYPPSVGGVQEVMRQIAERLAADGVDVTVATSTHSERPTDTVRNGVRVVSFAVTGNWTKSIKGPIEEYRSFLRQGDFDAILIKAAQQWTFDAAVKVIPELRGRKLFIPCGFSELHNPNYANYFKQMPEWLRLFDGLIFYANDYQDIAFARKNNLSTIHLIPNGVDEREFLTTNDNKIRERLGIDPEHNLILTVGSKVISKGHWEIIQAFAAMKTQQSTTLVINANEPKSPFSRQAARQIKNIINGKWPLSWIATLINRQRGRKRVLIVDLPRKDLVDLYKSANLFVLASHVEYSPLVLFEANAAGTPFLSSPAGNSVEICGWTKGGKVIHAASQQATILKVPDLAIELERAMDDTSQLKQIGEAGRFAIFNKGFTWAEITKTYHNLLLPEGNKNPSG